MTLTFTARTGAIVLHGSNPEDTLALLRQLELGTDLDLDIVIGVHEGHVDLPALADGLRGRGTIRSIDPGMSIAAGANRLLAEMVEKGIQFGWMLNPTLLPTPSSLSILTRHMISVPDCAVVGSRIIQRADSQTVIWSDGGAISTEGGVRRLSAGMTKSRVPKPRGADVEAVPFPGSLYRASAIAALGPFGDSDIVDGHDVGWSDRARRAGWRVMMGRRAQAWLGVVGD